MKKPFFLGVLGFLSLIALYFLVMLLLSRSLKETVIQFQELWLWIVLLSTGFGIQVGLYARTKILVKKQIDSSRGIVVATGATSSVSMLVCCAHHLTEVLPIAGLSALSIFLIRYQVPILMVSLFFNVLGIIVMIRNMKKLAVSAQKVFVTPREGVI